jgi:DNA processing protein
LALVERVSPHLNGPTAHRLAGALDASRGNIESGIEDEDDRVWIEEAVSSIANDRVQYWSEQLQDLSMRGVRLITICDEEFPSNLHCVHNPPPLLFVRGFLRAADVRAVAVVGARSAGPEGLKIARELSHSLAEQGVVVISGLAEGIDTAAHQGAIDGHGRTIAVFGTGIDQIYPSINRGLAERVEHSGVCISQFWPKQSPTPWTFPVRNIVTSGMSLATVVVEASETSGARSQAMEALKHGKRVVLMKHLVDKQQWARDLVNEPAVTAVSHVEEVLAVVNSELASTDADIMLSM